MTRKNDEDIQSLIDFTMKKIRLTIPSARSHKALAFVP